MAEENKKTNGVSDNFKEALGYIGPRLISLLVGGNEGMNVTDQLLKGAEAERSTKYRTKVEAEEREYQKGVTERDFQFKKEEAERKYADTSGSTDTKQYVHTKTLQPVEYDERTKIFTLLGTNKIIPATEVRDEKIFMGEGVEGRFGKKLGQRRDEQVAKYETKRDIWARSMHNLNTMETILNNNKDDLTGFLDQARHRVKQATGQGDPEFTTFQQAATDFGSMYIKEISGVAVSEQEHKRLKQALPNIGAQENVNLQRIRGLRRLMEMLKVRHEKVIQMVGGKLPPQGSKEMEALLNKAGKIDIDAILKSGQPQQIQKSNLSPKDQAELDILEQKNKDEKWGM